MQLKFAAAAFETSSHYDTEIFNYFNRDGGIKAFKTGIGVEIPEGYELQIRSRSGLAYKNYVTLLNGIGTIDSDYRGEMQVLLRNCGSEDFVVEPGMRIAQGIVAKYERVEWEEVEKLSNSNRSAQGFGHTGLK